MILGIDEVGRGAWAGPMVVGAVAIEPGVIEGLADSKMLAKKRREELARLIRYYANWIGIGWVSAKKIDEIGLGPALRLAAHRSVAGAPEAIKEIIIDGTIRLIDTPNVTTLKKADQLIPAVSAASIVAKVARDQYMSSLHNLFPHYSFHTHVGYGTKGHQAALKTHGPSLVHRMSFSPLAPQAPVTQKVIYTAGYRAESAAVNYLIHHGFDVLVRNWKTKRCEVDIIAKKADTMYFVEVKYRKTNLQGTGFDYITQAKQRQMVFAQETWCSLNNWTGPVRLAAAQVSGAQFVVDEFSAEIRAAEAHHARTRQFGR